jgi:hypothetical protein
MDRRVNFTCFNIVFVRSITIHYQVCSHPSRATCFRCHCSPQEAELNWRAMNEVGHQGSGKGQPVTLSVAWRPGKGYANAPVSSGYARAGLALRPRAIDGCPRPSQQARLRPFRLWEHL